RRARRPARCPERAAVALARWDGLAPHRRLRTPVGAVLRHRVVAAERLRRARLGPGSGGRIDRPVQRHRAADHDRRATGCRPYRRVAQAPNHPLRGGPPGWARPGGAGAADFVVGLAGVASAPDLAFFWVPILGLSLGAIFPLVLTLPLDVADDPARVGSVAAMMLLGGYVLSSFGPVVLGAARDITGNFAASEWILVVVAAVEVVACVPLSP